MTAQVLLTNGDVALIDDIDLPRVSGLRWSASRNPHTTYAITQIDRKTVYLHRLVMDATAGIEVDHKNGDGLDCRRSTNLRLATRQQQCANVRAKPSRSGYRCVHAAFWRNDRWQAQIQVNGVTTRGRWRPSPEEAARDYDRMAREHFGEFARLNFPGESEQAA
ncbi:HNH endonuclease [Nocardioides sp.]|uniref:HNH endonuclease n=1 Tax=Nocardioides sp. TaxID=35761 RepID=UPI002BCD2693|nr:HNH endonuclease [Nocardioides sp.]HXH79558.1 HNH endonuclease [Nocardioides sp.]